VRWELEEMSGIVLRQFRVDRSHQHALDERAAKSSDAYQWVQTQAALLGKRRAIAASDQTTTGDEDRE